MFTSKRKLTVLIRKTRFNNTWTDWFKLLSNERTWNLKWGNVRPIEVGMSVLMSSEPGEAMYNPRDRFACNFIVSTYFYENGCYWESRKDPLRTDPRGSEGRP